MDIIYEDAIQIVFLIDGEIIVKTKSVNAISELNREVDK